MELKIIDQREVLGKKFKIYGDLDYPLFLASDVAEWIEHSNHRVMLGLIDENEKVVNNVYTLGGNQESWFVTEDGLYELLMQSRKPIAKQFKTKVKEILKDIRKLGMYMTDNLLEKTINDPQFMINLLTQYKEEKEKNKMLVHAGKLYTATEIAKELGFKSATAFNENLKSKGIQYKVNNTWVLTSDYADKKYTSIKQDVLENGKVIYDRKWTGLGREFLIKLYSSEVVA